MAVKTLKDNLDEIKARLSEVEKNGGGTSPSDPELNNRVTKNENDIKSLEDKKQNKLKSLDNVSINNDDTISVDLSEYETTLSHNDDVRDIKSGLRAQLDAKQNKLVSTNSAVIDSENKIYLRKKQLLTSKSQILISGTALSDSSQTSVELNAYLQTGDTVITTLTLGDYAFQFSLDITPTILDIANRKGWFSAVFTTVSSANLFLFSDSNSVADIVPIEVILAYTTSMNTNRTTISIYWFRGIKIPDGKVTSLRSLVNGTITQQIYRDFFLTN